MASDKIDRCIPVTKLGIINTLNAVMFLHGRFEGAKKVESSDLENIETIAEMSSDLLKHVKTLSIVKSEEFTPKDKGPNTKR